jgi:hypothetical protein
VEPTRGFGRRPFIQEIGDFQFRALLHAGMSIHLRVGDRFFSAMPIAWNLLVTQYEGPGQAVQELTSLLEAIDTLLTLAAPVVADIRGWLNALVAALTQAAPELPDPENSDVPHAPLRITTRTTVERNRELVYSYCVQMLRVISARTGMSTTALIQNLRMPRNRTDKLFSLLDAERKKAKEAAGRR